jgi:N-acetylated-alpha-linked acidic dipeptidase
MNLLTNTPMKRLRPIALFAGLLLVAAGVGSFSSSPAAAAEAAATIMGFRDAAAEAHAETTFLAVPDPRRAEEHLRILTQAPHIAGSPEDRATADYVAEQFRAAGLETEIVPYRVWLNYPVEIRVDVIAPPGVEMHGPTREHVEGDPFQDDPRVVMPYNGMSPTGDAEADVVYANYGSPEDFRKLAELKVDVKGKIVLVRYGQNFRGVKAFVAQEHGAAGVLIYSDPADDGWRRGDKYPMGPWRPDSGVQRGSVGFMFQYPGDPTTPGIASVVSLPDSQRTPPERAEQLPRIPTTPLSYADAWPILEHLSGPVVPREWQGALPFTYHVGSGPVRVRLHVKQDFQYRTIWDVIGKIRGSEIPGEMVVAGNHRDAWVYGAVDPNSGTAAMLEAVRGLGALLKTGWRPRRTIIFGSWDAEEEGLIGSTEWGEEHATELAQAVAYINMDVAVAGPDFTASAVPSLKDFIREVAHAVPSPKGGSVYDVWRTATRATASADTNSPRPPVAQLGSDTPVGDLGSGSDYTVFLQHLGVPSTDVGSSGNYGVYHSAFDNFAWFKKFGDPDFKYEQQMARIYGLEVLRLAGADVLPYDYEAYGREISVYIKDAQNKAREHMAGKAPDFKPAIQAVEHFTKAGASLRARQHRLPKDAARLNRALIDAERALLLPEGLPNRSWYHHAIFAPGQYTGYAAVVIPGVNEAIDKGDADLVKKQIAALAAALDRARSVMESYR